MKLTTLTATGKSGTLEASDAVFGVTPNQQLIAQAVRVYRSNKRQATGSAKTRAAVARTKKKWFKQKGTGNARHGARSAPIFVGGGVAHGPKLAQHFGLNMSQQMKKSALISALSAQSKEIKVIDALESVSGKTKEAADLLKQAGLAETKVLVILSGVQEQVLRSLKNLPNVLTVQASLVTTLEVAMADAIVFTKSSLKQIEERLDVTETKKEVKSKTTKTK